MSKVPAKSGNVALPVARLEAILTSVSRSGNLAKACEGAISPTAFCAWLRAEGGGMQRLDDARRIYAERIMAEMIEIADEAIDTDGAPEEPAQRAEWIKLTGERRARRIDARKFVASAMLPAKAAVNIDASDNRRLKQTFLGAAITGGNGDK